MQMQSETQHPAWPPGLWRRIILQPGSGWIGGALEDDMHRFHMRFDHADGRIVRAHAQALRHPWSACPGAAPHIADELTGELLADVARRDPALHCTHLYDLAVVLAAHARDTVPTRFDMRVADRVGERTTATLHENGKEMLRWQLVGTAIEGSSPDAGRDLRKLSQWKQDLSPRDAERATMLRRAVFISGGRQFVAPAEMRAADQGPARLGVCFNYQLPQASESTRTPDWRKDFSAGDTEPLAGLDAAAVLGAMA
jgi:Protein of unknown function (DUF2889)